MANTTLATQDRRDSRRGVSGGTMVENGCVEKDQTATDLHDHINLHHHKPSMVLHSELVLPSYKPSCSSTPIYYSSPQKSYSDMSQDCHSLSSQDSGIPTLEINPPEPILHSHQGTDNGGLILDSSHDSPATLPLDDDPSDGNSIRKSSTFPRSGYDSIRLFSPNLRLSATAGMSIGGGALNRSDDISVCSVSSMSTELSVSNEDILDFTVTSDSSAIVTLETDDSGSSHFSDVTLSSTPGDPRDLWRPVRPNPGSGVTQQQENGRQKKLGPLASLFNKSLFARRVKDSRPVEQRDPGWKLFGKIPPREGPAKDPKRIQKEYETKSGRAGPGNPTSPRQSVRKNLDFEPLSTTALILEDRPANLPAKSAEEAQKHRQQYEEMVAQAKKRELKEAQKRKKQLEDRCKLEESIGTAAQTWNQDILPNWSTVCTSRRVRDLWWQGIPPSVRGKVWSLAVGNELNITHELYNICLARAKEKWKTSLAPSSEPEIEDAGSSDRESSLELIKLDISRTFPHLCIFQQGGPYHDVLHSILGAYTCYRPDVGYVQGMSFIAAVLILNLDTANAFIAFANLLNKPCQMAFFRVDHSLMLTYFSAFEVFFEENLPKLFAHFKKNNLTPDIYLIDWIFTLYSKSLPLDLACRVWDVFCRDGEEFLFRTALGLLRLYQDVLTCMDFIHMAQFLTRLPDLIPAEQLFQHIAAIHMTSRNRKWAQVLQALQKDPERGSPVLKR
ncbi:TBC1 domain family member 14 isoform X1 [Acanthopagrus latus]|uniref:TBC1 domain family member 14 isoform X1 n=1 Tax=Acanthopagrus latus TaxID=8177 RepID=UPI00187BF5D7|nr:TBC1 domain family member 14 isoform X1 [Acanthopagrus latus]XP_036968078.1 TBC1 domain family member 14 isoform X1 [Acanthopagrus latus]XP_036968079.1 TBC1 domain family member 14 isoform X1 [Acanthopagrus latus]